MKRFSFYNILLFVISMLSIYAILYIGLGYLWPIGESKNAEKINMVLLNLSYSFLAGGIFYIFTSSLPHYSIKKQLRKPIEKRLRQLKYHVSAIIQAYCSKENQYDVWSMSRDELSDLVNSKNMRDTSFFGTQTGMSNAMIDFLTDTRKKILRICNETLTIYGQYLGTSEIEILEFLFNSEYFNLLDVNKTSNECSMLDSSDAKRALVDGLYDIILKVRKL